MTAHYCDYDTAVKKIVAQVGKVIVMGVPLGIGKPIGLLNAFYQSACADSSIQLTLLTGLTLARPSLNNELEKRFLEPILARVLGDYVDPLYEKARELQQLPTNIKVIEFFLTPGKYIHNGLVQQDYISSSYSHVVRDSLYYSPNVLCQQVACSQTNPDSFSLSANTDLFHEITFYLREAERAGKKIAIVAEVNQKLPYMLGEAEVSSKVFTDVVDARVYHSLYAIPHPQLSVQDHLLGLYSSALVKDDGCLQIGIGKLGDAIANALIMRHNENGRYQELLARLEVNNKFAEVVGEVGAVTAFSQGLYASTEMLSDGYLQLYREGLLKKRVYDHVGLQKLLNARVITENITPDLIDVLLENGFINARLTAADSLFLQKFGILNAEIKYQEGNFILPSGEMIVADLTLQESKRSIITQCLGTHLQTGKIIHAGFFVGSNEFYQQLRDFTDTELQQIEMTAIARTNTLTWSPELLTLQRQRARFINAALKVTLAGSVVSDGLANWQEISGVGGQFDFAVMAYQLPQARCILNCHSTRTIKTKVESNVVWDYPNMTIPRYLRDIIVTEYGIADCRSKTDTEVIKALLNIADSRFQQALLKTAKKFAKVAADYEIPACFQNNLPETITPVIRELQLQGYCKPYPFACELTEDEQVLTQVLSFLKECSWVKRLVLVCLSCVVFSKDDPFKSYLLRMGLTNPKTMRDFFYKKLLKFILRRHL